MLTSCFGKRHFIASSPTQTARSAYPDFIALAKGNLNECQLCRMLHSSRSAAEALISPSCAARRSATLRPNVRAESALQRRTFLRILPGFLISAGLIPLDRVTPLGTCVGAEHPKPCSTSHSARVLQRASSQPAPTCSCKTSEQAQGPTPRSEVTWCSCTTLARSPMGPSSTPPAAAWCVF